MPDLQSPITITGDGSSLWGPSAGEFQITGYELIPLWEEGDEDDDLKGCARLQLFGPATAWTHYTDNRIEAEVQKEFVSLVCRDLGWSGASIGWSEQGQQPENGWDFDAYLEEDAKS